MTSRLLDPKRNGKFPFEWRGSAQTDIAATFRRIRTAQKRDASERVEKVQPLKRAKS